MINAMPRIAIAARDFDGLVRFFCDRLGMPVVDISTSTVTSLGAKLAMCVPDGGSNIELMSPAVADAPLSQSLEKFLDRRGEGLFALMLEAADPDAEADLMLERGLAVLPLMAGAGGRDVHPKSNHGVLIRIYPDNSFQATPEQIQLSSERTLGLSGIVKVIIAVADINRAIDCYGRQFGLSCADPEIDTVRGVAAVRCEPAAGGAIELVSAVDRERPFAAALCEHIEARGEGMYALVLGSNDLDATQAELDARDVAAGRSVAWPDSLVLEPVFGTRLLVQRSAV